MQEFQDFPLWHISNDGLLQICWFLFHQEPFNERFEACDCLQVLSIHPMDIEIKRDGETKKVRKRKLMRYLVAELLITLKFDKDQLPSHKLGRECCTLWQKSVNQMKATFWKQHVKLLYQTQCYPYLNCTKSGNYKGLLDFQRHNSFTISLRFAPISWLNEIFKKWLANRVFFLMLVDFYIEKCSKLDSLYLLVKLNITFFVSYHGMMWVVADFEWKNQNHVENISIKCTYSKNFIYHQKHYHEHFLFPSISGKKTDIIHTAKKKLDQLHAIDMQHAPAKLPSKLHMLSYVEFLAQSLCIKAWLNQFWSMVGVSTEASWDFLHVNCRQLSKFFCNVWSSNLGCLNNILACVKLDSWFALTLMEQHQKKASLLYAIPLLPPTLQYWWQKKTARLRLFGPGV
ncbi:hypothetical protein VP01_1380g3 [Puccinia sorghi]|uniref:Uncharacterized protein n=1 Tax=Puccinia sorghi TaxID=27349 RepID=A0A0L6VNA4_9BASI|nr:hypothetical protein VP01_1380g3 [Puccinia sorghi]